MTQDDLGRLLRGFIHPQPKSIPASTFVQMGDPLPCDFPKTVNSRIITALTFTVTLTVSPLNLSIPFHWCSLHHVDLFRAASVPKVSAQLDLPRIMHDGRPVCICSVIRHGPDVVCLSTRGVSFFVSFGQCCRSLLILPLHSVTWGLVRLWLLSLSLSLMRSSFPYCFHYYCDRCWCFLFTFFVLFS